jgi:hypothetical protein
LIFDTAGTARTVLYYYRPILAGGMGEVLSQKMDQHPVSKYRGADLSEEGKFYNRWPKIIQFIDAR